MPLETKKKSSPKRPYKFARTKLNRAHLRENLEKLRRHKEHILEHKARLQSEQARLMDKFNELRMEYHRMQQSFAQNTPRITGSLKVRERRHIERVLNETGWVLGGKKGAASRLGIKRTTLIARLHKLGIRRPMGHRAMAQA
jgi:transcriptional regulator with GAF, ATPase, and Fis domain